MTTFYIQQFGCRATQADGAALERQLLDRGCTPAPDPATASIVVLNTCTVTAAADAQARDAIRKIHTHNPAAQLIVTGCYAQRAPEELASLPGVTWVVGNSHKPQIPKLIDSLASTRSPLNSNNFLPTAALFPDSPDALYHSFVGAQFIAPQLGKISTPEPSHRPAQILTGNIFSHPEFLSAPIQGGGIPPHPPHPKNPGRLQQPLLLLRYPVRPRQIRQPPPPTRSFAKSTPW